MTRRQCWRQALAVLLAVVLTTVGVAPGGASPSAAPVHHEAALATHHDGAATLARSPHRIDARAFGALDIAAPPPGTVRPLRPAVDSRATHAAPSPRTRRAPSAGDRAPPSH